VDRGQIHDFVELLMRERRSPEPASRMCEADYLVDTSSWPTKIRVILRKERHYPDAQSRFPQHRRVTGHRIHHDTGHGAVAAPGGLELRHRRASRVEDRIRQAKATGLPNMPSHRAVANAVR
jgi:hypothetical protein